MADFNDIKLPEPDPDNPMTTEVFLESLQQLNPAYSMDAILEVLGEPPRHGPWPSLAEPAFCQRLCQPGRTWQSLSVDQLRELIGNIMRGLPPKHTVALIELTFNNDVLQIEWAYDIHLIGTCDDLPVTWNKGHRNLADYLATRNQPAFRDRRIPHALWLTTHRRGLFWEDDPDRYAWDDNGHLVPNA